MLLVFICNFVFRGRRKRDFGNEVMVCYVYICYGFVIGLLWKYVMCLVKFDCDEFF